MTSKITKSSGNVFDDLGVERPASMTSKQHIEATVSRLVATWRQDVANDECLDDYAQAQMACADELEKAFTSINVAATLAPEPQEVTSAVEIVAYLGGHTTGQPTIPVVRQSDHLATVARLEAERDAALAQNQWPNGAIRQVKKLTDRATTAESALAECRSEVIDVLETNQTLHKRYTDMNEKLFVTENELTASQKREAGLREALDYFLKITEPASKPAFVDPDYGVDVAALGERIGYGALISSASASWRESAKV